MDKDNGKVGPTLLKFVTEDKIQTEPQFVVLRPVEIWVILLQKNIKYINSNYSVKRNLKNE